MSSAALVALSIALGVAQQAAPPSLEGRSVAVLKTDVGGELDPAFGPQVTAKIAEALRTRTTGKVISADDVLAILQNEKQKSILGACNDDSCLAELASALGAEVVVSGKLVKADDKLSLTLSVVDGASAQVIGRVQEVWGGDSLLLLGVVPPMIDRVLAGDGPVPTGALELVGVVDGSKILVDETVKGTAPAGQMAGIAVGGHKLTVQHDEHKPFEKWIVIEKDKVASAAVTQEPADPAFYQTWWFWTAAGAGVVVAAAAATGVALYALGAGGETGVSVSVNADKTLGGAQ